MVRMDPFSVPAAAFLAVSTHDGCPEIRFLFVFSTGSFWEVESGELVWVSQVSGSIVSFFSHGTFDIQGARRCIQDADCDGSEFWVIGSYRIF